MSCSFCWKPQGDTRWSIVHNHSFLAEWNITGNNIGGVAGPFQCSLPEGTGHCSAQGEWDCPVQHLFFSGWRSDQSVASPLSRHGSGGLPSSLWDFLDASLSLSSTREAAHRKSPRCPAALLQQIAVAVDLRWRFHVASDSIDAYWNRCSVLPTTVYSLPAVIPKALCQATKIYSLNWAVMTLACQVSRFTGHHSPPGKPLQLSASPGFPLSPLSAFSVSLLCPQYHASFIQKQQLQSLSKNIAWVELFKNVLLNQLSWTSSLTVVL